MDNTKLTAVRDPINKEDIKHSTGPAEDTASTKMSSLIAGIYLNDQHLRRRIIQNFFLIWADQYIDESTNHYQHIITQLQCIVNSIYTYTDINSCIKFLSKLRDENAFLIVSSGISQQLLPLIHDMSQIDAIYIFDNEATTSKEELINKWSKIKGVHADITSVCEALKENVGHCNRNSIPFSFVPSNDGKTNLNLDQLDPSFMYTQIFKEILLNNEYNQQSIEDLVVYCRQYYEANYSRLNTIVEFECEYRNHSPIWWYTRPCFIYEMLNRALRNLEADTIIKLGFFINDLHHVIKQFHTEQYGLSQREPFTVYRGQGLSQPEFEKLMKTQGGLM